MSTKANKFVEEYFTKQNLLISGLIVCLTLFSFFNLSLIFYKPTTTVMAENNLEASDIQFWQGFLAIYPTYFEGWVELSNLYVHEGNYTEAKLAYDNAFKINPNSEKLIILRLKLGVQK